MTANFDINSQLQTFITHQFIQNFAQYNSVRTNSPSRPSPIAGSRISSRLIAGSQI